jgi:hypothetical protein
MQEQGEVMAVPEDCLVEMKTRDKEKRTMSLLSSDSPTSILPCEEYCNLKKLIRVTAYVLKLNANIKNPNCSTSTQTGSILAADDIHLALMRASQVTILEGKNFQQWKGQFGLFLDDNGLWRCGGRLENADAPQTAIHPVLLNNLTLLIVRDCHEKVLHRGVKANQQSCAPSIELCKGEVSSRGSCASSQYAGDSKENPIHHLLLHHYPHLRVNKPNHLPIQESTLQGLSTFETQVLHSQGKCGFLPIYLLCYLSVSPDIVPDMIAKIFLRCFKCFTVRRGSPVRVVSENPKTFTAAARMVTTIMESSAVTSACSGPLTWREHRGGRGI